jgi:hypothetical protein
MPNTEERVLFNQTLVEKILPTLQSEEDPSFQFSSSELNDQNNP